MNIKRVWLECEDENGQSFMVPATPEDLKALQEQAESGADAMTRKDLETAQRYLDSVGVGI